jgi:transposase
MEIPGVGPLLASAFVASIADPTVFKSGRDVAAWIGLVPKQNSSGGKERLGGISRAGNRYLRQMLVVGAMAVIRHEGHSTDKYPKLTTGKAHPDVLWPTYGTFCGTAAWPGPQKRMR